MNKPDQILSVMTESVPGMSVAEIAAKAKVRGVRDPSVATPAHLTRLRKADKVRGEKCADGVMRWRKA